MSFGNPSFLLIFLLPRHDQVFIKMTSTVTNWCSQLLTSRNLLFTKPNNFNIFFTYFNFDPRRPWNLFLQRHKVLVGWWHLGCVILTQHWIVLLLTLTLKVEISFQTDSYSQVVFLAFTFSSTKTKQTFCLVNHTSQNLYMADRNRLE